MNTHGTKNRWIKYRVSKQWKGATIRVASPYRPDKPWKHVKLILTRYSSSQPDYDGLVIGFKHIVDGLVDAGILENDKLSNTGPWDCRWHKCKPKEGKIGIQVLLIL